MHQPQRRIIFSVPLHHLQGGFACGMADMFRSNFGSKVLAQHSAAIGPTPWLVALGASARIGGWKSLPFQRERWWQ